ncbi:MAG: hypothetical protein HY074_20945 [Deltaproteobacteria bacterium]|nr:hypothetical protein [Deltaproteobacteria bacterium]
MKSKFIMAVSFLGLVGAQLPAQARSLMPPVWSAELTRIHLDEQLPYKDSVVGAEIEINYAARKATLTLMRKFSCPVGQFCAQVMPMPIVIELPIVDRNVDECGSKLIKAAKDLRRVDGALQTLAIRDNTANHCPSFVARPATEVIMKSEYHGRGRPMSTRSTFEGEALRPVYNKM